SLFQSMPDSWAIDQLFPIVPIHRLAEEPTRRGILADITCDSDGKIDHFVDKREDKKILELHEVHDLPGEATGVEPYYLGVFLLGASQEILVALHNLLADTHAVHISLAPAADAAPATGPDGSPAHVAGNGGGTNGGAANGGGVNGGGEGGWEIDEVI